MNKKTSFITTAIFVLFLLSQSVFVVDQRKIAIVLQFGEYVKSYNSPGLKLKIPFLQDVLFFDNRVQNLSADTSEVIASDQKTMRVDAFTKFKIIDGLKFYQRAKDESSFKARLAPILDSSLRQVLGSEPFKSLLTPERTILMRKIKELVNAEAQDFGVEIVDVRIMRADLPDLSRQAVYERMKSDREKEAKEIRAEGAEVAQKIMATADKDKTILLAEAKRKAETLKGEGDSESIKIYAHSFGKDPEFFDFYRTMQAYKESILADNTQFVITTDNEYLRYFKKVP
jgi:membrane protease subunit HflC